MEADVRSLSPIDSETAFVGLANKGVFRTIDGSGTWEQVVQGFVSTDIRAIAFIDSATGFAGTRGNGVFKTSDAGASWKPVANGLDSNMDVYALEFVDPATAYAGTLDGVFKTTNRAENWTSVGAGPIHSVADLAFVDAITGYVSTFGGNVFKTTNGGLRWTRVDSELQIQSGVAQALAFWDANNGVVGTDNGLFRTVDGGQNWLRVDGQISAAHIDGIDVVSASIAYVATRSGGVFRTNDAGLAGLRPTLAWPIH